MNGGFFDNLYLKVSETRATCLKSPLNSTLTFLAYKKKRRLKAVIFLFQYEKQRGEKYKQKRRRCHQEGSYCKVDVQPVKS